MESCKQVGFGIPYHTVAANNLALIPAQATALRGISIAHLEWLYSESYGLALKMLKKSWVELVSPILYMSTEVCL